MGISAHRGGGRDGAGEEGSLAAYQAAVDLGVDLVEVDVRRRADGTLVCSHDAPPGPTAPLLADVLRAAAAGGVGGHVDVKESGYEAELVAAVAACGLPVAYYTTGDAAAVARIRAAGGLGLLTVGPTLSGTPPLVAAWRIARDFAPYRRIARCDGAAVQFRFVNPLLRWWMARRGLALLVYTVDGPASLWWLLRRHGVTAVVTDRPARARALRPGLRPSAAR